MHTLPVYFATTSKGLETVLAQELSALGGAAVEVTRAGVSFRGTLEVAYRACLWSRVANRILLPLATFAAPAPHALYEGVRSIPWWEHLNAQGTLAVDCSTSESALTHSHYAALKTKDAIVDQLRERSGARPSVDVVQPDVRVNVYVHRDQATVSIDLSGESLHRRAYRGATTAAPLKENLAAGILLLAQWPQLAAARLPFLDPLCGSGTLPIEAARIAADIAPGRMRTYFGFLGWRGHDAKLWATLQREAEEREIREPRRLPIVHGYDASAAAVRVAIDNVERAGLRGRVHIERRDLADCAPINSAPTGGVRGLVVTNAPYGERLGSTAVNTELYATMGDVLRQRFLGWTACVLTGNMELGRRIGLKPQRRLVVYNGPIECRLLLFPISASPVQGSAQPRWRQAGNRADPEPIRRKIAPRRHRAQRGPR